MKTWWKILLGGTAAVAASATCAYVYFSYWQFEENLRPSIETFSKVVARDGIPSGMTNYACEPQLPPPIGDEYVQPAENPFNFSVVLYEPDDSNMDKKREREINRFRALALADMLKLEKIKLEKNGVLRQAERYRLTAAGWRQIAGRGCFYGGSYDDIRVIAFERQRFDTVDKTYQFAGFNINAWTYAPEYKITAELKFKNPDAVEPWIRPPAIREKLNVINHYITNGNHLPLVYRYSNGAWQNVYATRISPDFRMPALSPERALALVDGHASSSALAVQTCLPLPKARPTLGIEQTAAPDYQLTFRPSENLDSGQREFVEKERGKAEALVKIGVLITEKKRSEVIYILNGLGQYLQTPATPCLSIGKSTTDLVHFRTRFDGIEKKYITSFATHTRVTEAADWVQRPGLDEVMPQLKNILEVGWGCRGSLSANKYNDWAVRESKCFAPS